MMPANRCLRLAVLETELRNTMGAGTPTLEARIRINALKFRELLVIPCS